MNIVNERGDGAVCPGGTDGHTIDGDGPLCSHCTEIARDNPEWAASLFADSESHAGSLAAAPLIFDITMMRGRAIAHQPSMSLAAALRHLLGFLPSGSVDIGFDGDPETSQVAVIRIDWAKVPAEIRQEAAR